LAHGIGGQLLKFFPHLYVYLKHLQQVLGQQQVQLHPQTLVTVGTDPVGQPPEFNSFDEVFAI